VVSETEHNSNRHIYWTFFLEAVFTAERVSNFMPILQLLFHMVYAPAKLCHMRSARSYDDDDDDDDDGGRHNRCIMTRLG
jgi:hypothetical protein